MMIPMFVAGAAGGSVDARNIIVRNTTKAGIGGTSTVSFSFNSSGAGSTTGATQSVPGSWTWRLSGASADYELYVTGSDDNGGTFTGTLNTWLSLGTTRTFSFSTTNNDSNWTGTYQIRLASGGTVVGTANVDMQVFTAP